MPLWSPKRDTSSFSNRKHLIIPTLKSLDLDRRSLHPRSRRRFCPAPKGSGGSLGRRGARIPGRALTRRRATARASLSPHPPKVWYPERARRPAGPCPRLSEGTILAERPTVQARVTCCGIICCFGEPSVQFHHVPID